MMRAMRENSKYIFYVLAIAFVGWMVFDVGMGVTGQRYGADVVLKVNGTEVHYPQYEQALEAALDGYRQQNPGTPMTDEEQQSVSDEVVDQLEQNILLEQAYRRLGITVSDQEIIDAARSSPPPEVMNSPEFQTNRQFDPQKWYRFLASGANPEVLLALEQRYRAEIPQTKLAEYLTADVYVPDAKLWRMWRDAHDSVTIALLAVLPQVLPDTAVTVTDADLAAYYGAHKGDFQRPAVAWVSYIAQGKLPDGADSAAALATARRIRAEVATGSVTKFADVAKRESADTVSGANGGALGWVKKDALDFDADFLKAMRAMRPGQVSEPVLTRFGYHIIRVDSARGDSMDVRHILVPVQLQEQHLDYVESRADTMDRLGAERDTATALDSVAARLGLRVFRAQITQGIRFNIGRWVIPDVGIWAFQARPGQTSKVIEAEPAYYLFRLDSLRPAGVPPLAEVRGEVLAAVRDQKKLELARARARALAPQLGAQSDLTRAAAAAGLPVEKLGPFTRLAPPGILQDEPEVLGAVFGLSAGGRAGPLDGRGGEYFVQVLARSRPDSSVWLAQRDAQREQIIQAARNVRIRSYLQALKARATIVDRRAEIFKASDQTTGS